MGSGLTDMLFGRKLFNQDHTVSDKSIPSVFQLKEEWDNRDEDVTINDESHSYEELVDDVSNVVYDRFEIVDSSSGSSSSSGFNFMSLMPLLLLFLPMMFGNK
jgi:hypothetical protein